MSDRPEPLRPVRHEPAVEAGEVIDASPRAAGRARRRPPVPVMLLGGVVFVVMGVAAVSLLLVLLVTIAVTVIPVVLVVGGTRAAVTRARRRTIARKHAAALAAGTAQLDASGPDPLPAARERFAQLRREYAAYECDALAVLRLPALADVSVPSTARFVEAFAEAQALDADGPVPPEHRDRFVAAVETAWRAWQAACDAAQRIRTSHLPAEERATVERVVRLLTIARESENDAERLVAYGKARSELAKLERAGSTLRIPQPAQAQLDNAYRGQLPA